MTVAARISDRGIPNSDARAQGADRDSAIDTMRGIAILMVIGIHSLPQPLDAYWQTLADAALRPCVPIFLFASGYLTAMSGRVILWKRIKAALIPYGIAFVAAYIYMALHNAAMDHRLTTTAARFVLAYVFVYYYVFVYIGCSIGLWLVFRAAGTGTGVSDKQQRLGILLALSIVLGLIAGSYVDPLLEHTGFSQSLIQEVRLRDVPFWFSFVAVGALVGTSGAGLVLKNMRGLIAGAVLTAYAIYAAVRIFGIGDAAAYDSVAFFAYATMFCVLLFVLRPRWPFLAAIGSGSYFIYLWHYFVIMALRDHASLHAFGAVADFAITYCVTAVASLAALFAVRWIAPSRFSRWLGA